MGVERTGEAVCTLGMAPAGTWMCTSVVEFSSCLSGPTRWVMSVACTHNGRESEEDVSGIRPGMVKHSRPLSPHDSTHEAHL